MLVRPSMYFFKKNILFFTYLLNFVLCPTLSFPSHPSPPQLTPHPLLPRGKSSQTGIVKVNLPIHLYMSCSILSIIVLSWKNPNVWVDCPFPEFLRFLEECSRNITNERNKRLALLLSPLYNFYLVLNIQIYHLYK